MEPQDWTKEQPIVITLPDLKFFEAVTFKRVTWLTWLRLTWKQMNGIVEMDKNLGSNSASV